MSESFGKITAVIISVYLMIIAPVCLLKKQSDCVRSMYIYDETEQFCNAIRNTGNISPGMYESFMGKLYGTGGSYNLRIEHRTADDEYYYSDDIIKTIESGSAYRLYIGDYVRVAVSTSEGDGTDRYVAICGGMIRDEDN